MMSRFLVAFAVLALVPAAAQAKSRADCEKAFRPQVGQAGKDVVWVPTPDEVVARMLSMANVGANDYVIDLGAGDGKIAIAAAKLFKATSLGVEYNPDMVKLANCMVEVDGVVGRARVIHGDIFKEDFTKATVITMYLLPDLNLCVRHRILAMKPGTRVASHQFNMGEWTPDETANLEYRSAYLWLVPARVAGAWTLRETGGRLQFSLRLEQIFQKVGGSVTFDGVTRPLVGAVLKGEHLEFSFADAQGVTRSFTGVVSGNSLTGVVRTPGVPDIGVAGTVDGAPAPAAWAGMAANCARFYK